MTVKIIADSAFGCAGQRCLAVSLAFTVGEARHEFTEATVIILIIGDKKAMINGFEVPLDVPPSIIKGRTFVPIRFISEGFGAEVEWDGETRTVRIFLEKTNTRVTLQINNTIARINERIVTLDAPPTIIQGRTLVPIRFSRKPLVLK